MMSHRAFLRLQVRLDGFRSPFRGDPEDGPCFAADPEPDDAYRDQARLLAALSLPEEAPPPAAAPVPSSCEDLWKNTRWLEANAHHLVFQGEVVKEAWVVIHGEAVESCHDTRALAHQHVKERGWQGVAILFRVSQTLYM